MKAHAPAPYDKADVIAIRACLAGNANEGQQKRAMDWIITKAANTYDLPYREDSEGGDRATAFASGRAFVGMQIVKMTRAETLAAAEAAERPARPKRSERQKSDDQPK